MRIRLFAVAALCIGAVSASAQDPRAGGATAAAIARSRAALAPLAALAGQWDGEATAAMGPGSTIRILQREDIVWGASGTVLFIRGNGHETEGASAGQVVFEAAALIWFDADSGRVRMQTHRDGRSVEPTVETRPDTLIWGFAVPGGRVRYTIAFGNDTWHEVGDFLREGAAPVRTIEMRLKRVRP